MPEHPNVEAARTAIEALMKGDMQTMAAGIADNAVWHIPGKNRWAGDFVGKPAILARFQEMAEAGAMPTVEEIHDIVGNEEHVLAMVRSSGSGPGGSTTQNSVWVFHVSDGQATEFWARNEDQAELDRVVG